MVYCGAVTLPLKHFKHFYTFAQFTHPFLHFTHTCAWIWLIYVYMERRNGGNKEKENTQVIHQSIIVNTKVNSNSYNNSSKHFRSAVCAWVCGKLLCFFPFNFGHCWLILNDRSNMFMISCKSLSYRKLKSYLVKESVAKAPFLVVVLFHVHCWYKGCCE